MMWIVEVELFSFDEEIEDYEVITEYYFVVSDNDTEYNTVVSMINSEVRMYLINLFDTIDHGWGYEVKNVFTVDVDSWYRVIETTSINY